MNSYCSIFTACLVLGLTPPSFYAQDGQAKAQNETANWALFQLGDLLQQRTELGRPYLRFMDKPSLSMGLYELKAGATDGQSPHKLDEVYYIVKGSAILRAGKDEVAVRPGSIVYVKAEVGHRFHSITEDLQVLVIFSKTKFEQGDPDQLAFEMKAIQAQRKSSENVWNRFLDVSTMAFGLYMLPRTLGGDQTLTHKVDEINIVVNGTAKFKMGDDEADVGPGSIVLVKEDVGHYFHTLSEDFDVLILFEKRKE